MFPYQDLASLERQVNICTCEAPLTDPRTVSFTPDSEGLSRLHKAVNGCGHNLFVRARGRARCVAEASRSQMAG
ncbi:hypothetical protein E2C01_046898 [Portunus trituberculatus]|uniref:Uncharacterized protein n=1 Tax=Portunus trituberculatus TaxID=210409 RepID=A0A5B7G6Y1_PORTR|nr:hypothetical protein [Portunus trituberculatus]